jgi:oligopeptidase B
MTDTRSQLVPPVAPRTPIIHREHNLERGDDYHWLKTEGRSGERVLAYLNAENAYLDALLSPHEALVQTLTQELRSHVQERDDQPPVQEGAWLYSTRTEEGREHPVYLRRPVGGGPEEILLDLNVLRETEGHADVWIGQTRPSPDGRFWAYLLDTTGQEVYELRVLDTRTRTLAEPPLPGVTAWTLAWSRGSDQLYYGAADDTLRPCRVWRHTLGQVPEHDALLLQEDDPTFRAGLQVSADGQTLLLFCTSTLSTEWLTLDAGDPAGLPTVLLPRERGVEYLLEDGGDHWLALTNQGGASEFKLVRFPKKAGLSWQDAQEVTPYDPARHLTGFQVFAGHLLLSGREGGYTRLWTLPRTAQGYGEPRLVTFLAGAATVRIGTNRVFESASARILYTSLTQPLEHLDLDLNTLQTRLVKATPVPHYDPDLYLAEQLWIRAPDGVQVPVSTVRRRDTALPAPTLLYGYGSYGSSADPSFRADRLPLLDRGWVWAVAHIRGGSELGRAWYEAGRLKRKVNSFSDFIAAGEGLIAAGVAQAGQLAASGRSAGGLLMGGVVNLRPELFRTALVGVPFVDVLSTMLDASIPLTTGEYDEWGNPEVREWYDVMAAYSPYDNLRAGIFPHLFVTGGLNDPRVAYWESAKYVARLRTLTEPGSGSVVLRTLMGAGHMGSSGRFGALRETAEEYAFVLRASEWPADRAPASSQPLVAGEQ